MSDNQNRRHGILPDLSSEQWTEIARKNQTRTLLLTTPAGDSSIICKQLSEVENDDYLSAQLGDLVRLENEPVQGVCVFHKVFNDGRTNNLIRQYYPGHNLATHVAKHASTLDVLGIGIRIIEVLERLHSRNLFHGNVKPSNIIIDPSGAITLVDGPLDLARLCCSIGILQDRDHIAYYSPEQLGIINDRPAAVSDLYSLGIVLFECLTGNHPFVDCDASNILVNKMLATPDRVKDRHGDSIPRVVGELISRLTCSVPGDRYQTASAVRHDLKTILSKLQQTKNPSIALSTSDLRSSIIEPNFIGRETEVVRLSQEMEKCSVGMAGIVTMEAVSGCGKSTLLDEYAALARQAGFWVVNGIGQSDVAPQSFQLLDELVYEIGERCREDQAFLNHLQENLQEEAAILSDVLPGMATILGWRVNQQSGPDVFGHARGINAICKLFSLLGTAQRPCTIIFDDCQWIDESSIKVIDQWNRYRNSKPAGERFVLSVISFRHEEVADEHPLRRLEPTSHLYFDLFGDAEIRAIAGSMAGRLPERVSSLVCKMASGSPFMATAVVRGMYETGGLESSDSGWVVNESAINDLQSSNDAAQLLARRIDLLPSSVQEFLSHGAILGKVFRIEIVRGLMGYDQVELNEAVYRESCLAGRRWRDLSFRSRQNPGGAS